MFRTTNETSNIVPEKWSAKFYDVLLAMLVFRDSVDDTYEGEIQDIGDTVNIHSIPEFSDAELLPEDQAGDADRVTISQQKLVINKRIYKDFIVTKKSLLQSLPFVAKLEDHAVYAVMKKIEKLIIGEIAPVLANQISYDSGTTLAFADILEGKELLDNADVPLSSRSMVVGAAQMNDIFNITDFKSSDFITSGAPVVTGQLPPALLGFVPKFTTLVGNTTYLFHKSFLTIAAQRGINVAEYDLGVQGVRASRINTDVLFGLEQLDGERVVTIG